MCFGLGIGRRSPRREDWFILALALGYFVSGRHHFHLLLGTLIGLYGRGSFADDGLGLRNRLGVCAAGIILSRGHDFFLAPVGSGEHWIA